MKIELSKERLIIVSAWECKKQKEVSFLELLRECLGSCREGEKGNHDGVYWVGDTIRDRVTGVCGVSGVNVGCTS